MVSIQEDVPYVMLNSLIRVGMAGGEPENRGNSQDKAVNKLYNCISYKHEHDNTIPELTSYTTSTQIILSSTKCFI